MAERHSDNDGSDIFWPGYVDAVTNLVLNLLFLLTIMIVAVFMFALELGRASQGGAGKTPVASIKPEAKVSARIATDSVQENIALKREIQRLNMQLAQQASREVRAGSPIKTVEVTAIVSKSLTGLDKTRATDLEVVVRFADDAVAFTPTEHDLLVESLKPIVASGKSTLIVEVPTGFSEAKRMGFYRAMAVRNLLIEMKMPKERIDVSVREGEKNANASIVRVKSH